MAGPAIPWYGARWLLNALIRSGHIRRLPQPRLDPVTGRRVPVYRIETRALDDAIIAGSGAPRSIIRHYRPRHVADRLESRRFNTHPVAYLLDHVPVASQLSQTTPPRRPGAAPPALAPVPQLSIRQDRRTGRAVALTARVSRPPRSRPHPDSRRRRDRKAAHYRRFLGMVNRTYGRADEVREVFDVFDATIGRGLGGEEFVSAYALSQAADYVVGRANRAYRDRVLRPGRVPWWVSPLVRRF